MFMKRERAPDGTAAGSLSLFELLTVVGRRCFTVLNLPKINYDFFYLLPTEHDGDVSFKFQLKNYLIVLNISARMA